MKIFLVVLLITGSQMGLAQTEDLHELARAKYVERFTEYFFVWPVLKQRSTSFLLESNANSHHRLTFKPNVKFHAGMGVYVFGIGVQFVLALPQDQASIRQYGKSDALDLQANILGRNWALDIFTQNYRGYYKEDAMNPTPAGSPLPQRPDIKTWNTGVNGAYFFDKRRFSIRSTFNYYERQLKSAGSLLISGNINTFSLSADSAIFSKAEETLFGANTNSRQFKYSTVAIAPGYAHNFVFHSWFVGAAVAIGPGMNWIHYSNIQQLENSAFQINIYTDIRFSLGYNGEHFFAGVTYNRQARNISYKNVLFSNTNDVFKFALGYRFRQVGILKKRFTDFLKPKSS